MNKVGLMIIESLSTLIPFHHNEFMRDVELVEYQVQHLYIVSVRVAMVVSELIGWKFPVAYYYKWVLVCIVTHIVRLCT